MTTLVDIDFIEIVTETDKAWLIQFNDHDEPVWLPKSMTEMDEKNLMLTIPMWLAEEKEIDLE